MKFRIKRYKKSAEYSYTVGVFPTLELLTHRPEDTLEVLIHPRGNQNQGVSKIKHICQENRIPYEFQEKTFSRLGARGNDYAIGVFQKIETGLDQSKNHVILINPSGMGNLGTIMRTMLGFGFRDLAIIEPAADIFHPDVVRASMGAFFQLRFARFVDFADYQAAYPCNLFPLMTDGAQPLSKVDFEPPYGLVFGNESAGLPAQYHTYGTSVRIPQTDMIDSLNIAVCVGITLYQASRLSIDNG